MPVWHAKTKKWVAEGRLQLVGLIQEQHADRCRLLAQWQGFDWPILQDPINVVGATAVPMFVAIDEHGIVRSRRPHWESFESAFLDKTFEDDAENDRVTLTPPVEADAIDSLDARSRGDALYLWQRDQRLNDAIAAYEEALSEKEDPRVRFRLGVCLLQRFEQQSQDTQDFQDAVNAWETALAARPNQYIWRRRIQQYGPRLTKPYPFYDWVEQAEKVVRSRGETPIRLAIRPSGAEIATPSRQFGRDTEAVQNPDPDGRIVRDDRRLIEASIATVPSVPRAGDTIRLHITLKPNPDLKAHWNNEAEPVKVWLDPSKQVELARNLIDGSNPPEAVSDEVRRFDLELRIPEKWPIADAETDVAHVQLQGYALCYICEDIDGVCQFVRKDLSIQIPIKRGD